MSMHNNKFQNAEAEGKIKTLPQGPEEKQAPGLEEVIDNPEYLDGAIGHAKMEHKDHLIISEKLFQYLIKNQKTDSLTYKGIELFPPGVREKLMLERKMNAEDHANMMGRKRLGAI